MRQTRKNFRVRELFEVQSGDCRAVSELDEGVYPLISCGDINNGLVGYYDIPDEWRYSRAITVAYNGSWPLTSKFHPYTFGAKDDVAVLLPKNSMPDSLMLYVAAMLNRMVWRYSYGRKCFREKLQEVNIMLPVIGDKATIDQTAINGQFARAFNRVEIQTAKSIREIFVSKT
jgi:type I restriction enzyme M protein